MIAMLPLRGWVGDAMALSMAVGHAVPAGHTAPATATATAAPMPCHATQDEAASHVHPVAGADDQRSFAGHGHLMCDLCNGPALDAQWLWSPTPSHPPLLLAPASEPFASQTARRDVRPPIS